jgi:hypothetical protein
MMLVVVGSFKEIGNLGLSKLIFYEATTCFILDRHDIGELEKKLRGKANLQHKSAYFL